MALTIEDGTGIVLADSWITLVEYDAYLLSFFNAARASDDATAESAIRRAVSYVSTLNLEGERTYGRLQGTCLPRTNLTDKDDIEISGDEIPIEFKKALFYFAKAELETPNALSPSVNQASSGAGSTVKRVREKIASLETETEYAVDSSTTTSSSDQLKSSTELAIEKSRTHVSAAMDILSPFLINTSGFVMPAISRVS